MEYIKLLKNRLPIGILFSVVIIILNSFISIVNESPFPMMKVKIHKKVNVINQTNNREEKPIKINKEFKIFFSKHATKFKHHDFFEIKFGSKYVDSEFINLEKGRLVKKYDSETNLNQTIFDFSEMAKQHDTIYIERFGSLKFHKMWLDSLMYSNVLKDSIYFYKLFFTKRFKNQVYGIPSHPLLLKFKTIIVSPKYGFVRLEYMDGESDVECNILKF